MVTPCYATTRERPSWQRVNRTPRRSFSTDTMLPRLLYLHLDNALAIPAGGGGWCRSVGSAFHVHIG
jgi:hypothetical protein